MSNFEVNVVLAEPQVRLEIWTDPATAGTPTRLNAFNGLPHKYWRLEQGATIEFRAVVDGVEAPADGALGGKLINWAWVETPYLGIGTPPAIITPVGGKASIAQVATVSGTPFTSQGHYVIQAWRESGGGVLIPFEIGLTV